MDRIKQFIRVEENGGNISATLPEAPARPPSSKSQIRTDQTSKVTSIPTNFVTPSFKAFQTVFKEPIYRILDNIKWEPFFVWPPKLAGDPTTQNQKLQCSYHSDKGHLTKNCYKFKTHLEQLVSDDHLAEYVDSNLTKPKERGTAANHSGTLGTTPTSVIHVIHNPLCTSILPTSFRSDIQKATHLKQSFGISDYFWYFGHPKGLLVFRTSKRPHILSQHLARKPLAPLSIKSSRFRMMTWGMFNCPIVTLLS